MLVRIWIRGSVPRTDSDPDPALFASDLQDANKKFFYLLHFEGTFMTFFKD